MLSIFFLFSKIDTEKKNTSQSVPEKRPMNIYQVLLKKSFHKIYCFFFFYLVDFFSPLTQWHRRLKLTL